MLQAFLNRLHASALAAQQGPCSTAPLAEEAAFKPPAPHEHPTTNPSKPVEADSHTSLSHTLHLADPASLLHYQAAAATVTQLGGTAAVAVSAGDPSFVEMAAAPLPPQAIGPEATSPLLPGSGSVAGAREADGAAVTVGDTIAAESQDAVVSLSAAAAVDAAAAAALDAAADTDADADAEPASGVDGGAVPNVPLSLEWLRSALPDVAAAFLMSVEGIVIFSLSDSSMYV